MPESHTPKVRSALHKLRILLVDDHPADVKSAADALRREFPEVSITEADGESFPEALRGDSFDAVITDEALRGSAGKSVLEQVHECCEDTPVILFTGIVSADACSAALNAGFADFVSKAPEPYSRLSMSVRMALQRRDLLREAKLKDESNRRQHEELLQQREELRAVNDTLERRIEDRTQVSERRSQQLRMLASELTKAEERERRRLAQMLHDDLQQMLVAARMHITAITPEASPTRMIELIRHVDDLLDRSIRLSRNLTHRASPPVLYDAGLAPAFEWLGRQVEEEHGLEVEVDCDDEAQPESQDTRIFLYQACRELLFNVVKHAGSKRCKLAMHRAGNDEVQVSVCDEGTGFDPDEKGEIGKGDGFGLFSIRERLELIGGRMEIESVAGEGTCVRLFAPVPMSDDPQMGTNEVHRTLVEALEETKPDVQPPAFNGAPIRVLLADDHRIIRASLAGLLRNQPGIEVAGQAGDGQEVIEKAISLRPDVVVMDVTMPVVDGVEATRRLMQEIPDLCVIALSMHEKEDMQQAMREAGAIRYLTKDGPPDMLIAAIRSCHAKRKQSQAVT
ncbi:MAG: response regulator [Planctomycetota bacterium]|nr:response regulator [Planctomycetaceae bacterium]MDQ3330757.1 response regulator [Planctomycetota bacterium]